MISLMLTGLARAFAADSPGEEVFPAGLVNFRETAPYQVLQYYEVLSEKELVMSSHVDNVRAKISLRAEVPLTKSQMVARTEKALREQAGIIITPLDDKRVSVTYNDALPITVVSNGMPVKVIQPTPRPGRQVIRFGPDGKPLTPVPAGVPMPAPPPPPTVK